MLYLGTALLLTVCVLLVYIGVLRQRIRDLEERAVHDLLEQVARERRSWSAGLAEGKPGLDY
jgi:hypothetical protein